MDFVLGLVNHRALQHPDDLFRADLRDFNTQQEFPIMTLKQAITRKFSRVSKSACRRGAHGANIVLEQQQVHNDMNHPMHVQALVEKGTSMKVESGEQVGQSIAGTCQKCAYYIFSQM